MILVDSNIIMYAAGGTHPHRAPSVVFLERVANGSVDAAVDAEVLQEVLHRYRAIGRWAEGRAAYDLSRKVFPRVIPITTGILDEARQLLDAYSHLTARDALHAAACRLSGADALCSYDRDLDGIEGVKRVEPPDAVRP